jgi:transcriptional regulator of arginine metabolism
MEAGLSAHLHIYASICILMQMNDLKERRQRAMADLIRSNALASQEELAERMAALGYAVTQATVSRDLEQIGAVKVRRGGQLSYALPDEVAAAPPVRLTTVFRDWVRSIEAAGNLLVIKTPPGSAHLVGVVLDQGELPEIVGTICGDDTIFVACRTAGDSKVLARKLSAEAAAGLH